MSAEIETLEEEEEEATAKRECADCGSEMDEDSGYSVEGVKGDVCQECYYDHVETCQLCGDEDVMPSDVSGYIVCKAELASIPGIYRIMHRPFLSIPMIGTGHLHESDVLFIDKLPKWDEHYEISGHICNKCSRPYHRTYLEAYKPVPWMMKRYGRQLRGCKTKQSKWRAILKMGRAGWAVVRQHVRKTILANPDMLRDLECDSIAHDEDGQRLSRADDSDWRKLKRLYNLPDLPTYHEWVFVEHLGVKVYYAGYKGNDSWMTWHPEPCFRSNGHGPDVFSVGSLPNAEKHRAAYETDYAHRMVELFKNIGEGNELKYWIERQKRDGNAEPDVLDYWRERVSPYDVSRDTAKAITIEAIELGFIRQDGIYNQSGERTDAR